MKITDILGFKHNGIEAIEAKLNGNVIWKHKEENEEIEFSVCPFPTSWTQVTQYLKYTATNEYGEWNISVDKVSNSSNILPNAFDNNTSNYFRSASLETDEETSTVYIELPKLICPKEIYIRYNKTKNAKIQGFNPISGTWSTLKTLTSSSSSKAETFEITTTTFYSKFRIVSNRYGSSVIQQYFQLFEFQIQSGSIKNIT